MIELFIRGGPVMWPILFLSLVSLTITIERGLFWWREKRRRDEAAVELIFEMVKQGDLDGALEKGRDASDPIARVLAAGLRERDFGFREGMEIEAGNRVEQMKRGLTALDTIITMAPLLGILGTVTGIITSFDFLGSSGIQEPQAVIGGIAEALLTTAAGLVVALLSIIPFNYFASRVDRAARTFEKAATRFEVVYLRGMNNHEDNQRIRK